MTEGLIWGPILIGGIVAALSPFVVKPILTRAGIFDVPNERSSHIRPTLRGCGIAQLLGIIITIIGLLMVFGWGVDSRVLISVSIGAVVASITGLIDDVRGANGLNTPLRLFIQVLVGTWVAIFAALIFPQPWWAIVIGLVFIAGYINVVNFMDGINGISGLHGLVVGISYAVIGSLTDHEWLLAIGLMIAVVFVVFLPWNFTPSGAFLGDVGSYLLGALISGAAVAAVFGGILWIAMIGPLAIYLSDTGVTIVRRLFQGKNIFSGHREHVYQRLISQGLHHSVASLIVTAFSIATGTLGILCLVRVMNMWVCIVMIILICGGYMLLPNIYHYTDAVQSVQNRTRVWKCRMLH